jgi:hypothetical protein
VSSLAACSEIASVERSKIQPEAGKGGSSETSSAGGGDDELKPEEPKPGDERGEDAGGSVEVEDAGC